MMMGRLGPDTLAAGALGSNLYFSAADLRARPDAGDLADDGDRTRPPPPLGARPAPHRAAGLWLAILVCDPDLDLALARRGDPAGHGPGPGAVARRPASICAGCNGRCCPSTATSCCVLSSRRWSGRAGRWSSCSSPSPSTPSPTGCLMFGNLGFPAMGIAGSGLATTLSSTLMFLGLAAVVCSSRSSGATICSGASGAPTGRASGRCCGSALPIAGTARLRGDDLQCRGAS